MSDLVEQVTALARREGFNRTPLKGVNVYKSSESLARAPLCYSQGIIIVVQGRKRVYLDQQAYDYNPENYLVLTLPLPAECETEIEPGKPLLSLMIDFDLGMLGELVRLFDEHQPRQSRDGLVDAKGLFVSRCTQELMGAVHRLVACLDSPLGCAALGPALVREVLYHILSGPQAAPLFALVSYNNHLARLERVLAHLHKRYSDNLDVEQLASMANMSASSFHRNFRQVTASSPKQYVKKLRLNRARELLLEPGIKVKQAAAEVGYESSTQFSREFKRYFGQSPQACARVG